MNYQITRERESAMAKILNDGPIGIIGLVGFVIMSILWVAIFAKAM